MRKLLACVALSAAAVSGGHAAQDPARSGQVFKGGVDLLTVDPYHLDGLVLLGEVLEQSGRGADAARAYERVLRFDPGRSPALTGLRRVSPGAALEAR